MDVLLFAATSTAHAYLLQRSSRMGNATSCKKNEAELLLEPAIMGDLHTIQSLVAAVVPPNIASTLLNQQDAAGNAAIHGAVFGGHLAVVEYLAENGASLELQNGLGCSPTWLAAGYNHAPILDFLLRQTVIGKSALLTPNKTGDSPLIAAASKGHAEICKMLIEHATEKGVAVELKRAANQSNDTALSVAIGAGIENEELIEMLCDAEVLNLVNAKGVTPLLIACERDLATAARKLINLGADTCAKNATTGDSILAVAAFCGSSNVVELLLNKNDPNQPLLNVQSSVKSGCTTPLWLATRAGHVNCARLLLEAGADASIMNKEGMTPLQAAEKYKRPDMVELLTTFEANK